MGHNLEYILIIAVALMLILTLAFVFYGEHVKNVAMKENYYNPVIEFWIVFFPKLVLLIGLLTLTILYISTIFK